MSDYWAYKGKCVSNTKSKLRLNRNHKNRIQKDIL